MTKEEIAAMIQEAILEERKRICAALREARPQYDWDTQNGSKFDWSMSMVAIAEEIEKGDLG